ncbi:MAG: ComF family protein [Candidatus Shapirobacteria bacterium]|jgi:ComF family protein
MSLIIDWLYPKKCLSCGKGEKYLCSECERKLIKGEIRKKEGFEGVISIYKYEGIIKKVIEDLKYGFVSEAGRELGQLMVKNLKIDYPNIVKYWQEEKYEVVPIPLYKHRKNWRGFNQSEILAKEIAKSLNLRYQDDFLVREKSAINQAKIKGGLKRRKNISGVFKIKKGREIPKKIILIDDVITSGATIVEALKSGKGSLSDLNWALSLAGVRK